MTLNGQAVSGSGFVCSVCHATPHSCLPLWQELQTTAGEMIRSTTTHKMSKFFGFSCDRNFVGQV